MDKHNKSEKTTGAQERKLREEREAMLKMKKNGSTKAQWLGALLIMATLLVSSQGQRFPGLIGCFEAHQNCFQDECQKLCERADFKKPVRGECEADPFPNPYNAVDCCCFVK